MVPGFDSLHCGCRIHVFGVNLSKDISMNSLKNKPGQNRGKRYLYLSFIILFLFAILTAFQGCSQKTVNSPGSAADAAMSLIPVPQKISFSGRIFQLNDSWVLEPGSISKDDPTVQSLITGFKEQGNLIISPGTNKNKHPAIRLTVRPGSVTLPDGDSTNSSLRDQAYRIKMDASEITIEANAPAGLFYGIQTLLQLLRTENGKVLLPEGEISDWPDLELRIIYQDCAHHLERMETFKRVIRQAAYYKINAIALKLEGHFQFASAKPIVEPYAFTPAEYQELTDYAKDHFIELIPYLDAPAHVSFILKHPEYASLRAMPNSNYELSVTSRGTYKLISGMFNDLMDANKGGKYIFLSTDEPYYVGKTEGEKKAARALGGNGKLLADFITKISDKLHDKGRTVIFWGEFPLTLTDISSLPAYLVNGEYNEKWAPAFKQQGIRQLIYTSTQGEEPLFPDYYPLSANEMVTSDDKPQQQETPKGRVEGLLNEIFTDVAGGKQDIMGVIVAAWSDAGLNPETFWLGYVAGTAAGWNTQPQTAQELTDRFLNSFYGPGSYKMDRVYQLLSRQAQFWTISWDREPSTLRTPIVGNSEGIYKIPEPATDWTLPDLPVPSAKDLSLDKDWSADNSLRLQSAQKFLTENDELDSLLKNNIQNDGHQIYNLQVFHSIAMLCRQNLNFLLDLQHIDSLLKQSAILASTNPPAAISFIDRALDQVRVTWQGRTEVFGSLTNLWYQQWYPVVTEANGRKFLFQADDVKDHLPGRTTDLSYLIYREIHYPLGKWEKDVLTVRNLYAKENNLPLRTDITYWEYY